MTETATEAQARVIGPLLDKLRSPLGDSRERRVPCCGGCGRSTWNVSAICDRCGEWEAEHAGEDAAVLGGTRYGYEDDVYGSCSCGETRMHHHEATDCARSGRPPMPERQSEDAAILVRQEHPNGCGIACLAMVTRLGYVEVRDALTEFLPRERDYGEEGIHHGITEWFLGRLGYAWRTLYAGHLHDPWPPDPFAPVHIAQVRQPSGNTHYVVVTEDGTVLDPLDGERKRLDQWNVPDGKFSGVNNVMGIWRVEQSGGNAEVVR